MADFVAVIRRTVDGLSDNVPEMRAKVYDKARSAVRRQLEGMKPRPSDDMINRQMVKLETAIEEVESEHAVALPAIDEPAIAELAVAPVPVLPDETREVAPSEEGPPATIAYEDVPVDAAADPEPPFARPEPVYGRDAGDMQGDVPESTEAPEHAHETDETKDDAGPSYDAQLATNVDSSPLKDEPAAGPTPSSDVWRAEPEQIEPEPERDPKSPSPYPPPFDDLADDRHDNRAARSEAVRAHAAEWSLPEDDEPDEVTQSAGDAPSDATRDDPAFYSEDDVSHDPFVQEKELRPAHPEDAPDWDLPKWSDSAPMPVTAHDELVWTEHVDTVTVAEDLPDLSAYDPDNAAGEAHAVSADTGAAADPSHSWAWDDNDPFRQAGTTAVDDSAPPAVSDWSWPVEKVTVSDEPAPGAPIQGWDEIDDLARTRSAATGMPEAGARDATGVDMVGTGRPMSYGTKPKRSRFNLAPVLVTLVALVLVAGGGYAYWLNRSRVNLWATELIASVTSSAPPKTTATPEATPQKQPATVTETTANTAASANQEVAAVAPSTKFTQRLQVDGTELDAGPAALPSGDNPEEEGKSVAAQTEASRPADSANGAAVPPTAQANPTQQPVTPVQTGQTADTSAAAQVPAGAQKMFLYEERLGQSAPTAIEGSVAWSIKEETPEEGAKPEPVIQAQITVPERGLTALMTIKRNADTSLPASHVIEFVFSLPETFEGGSIDSVQRVSMKRTEQDRGDALIAVPAKITEDFHMIALNDFPEAVATNTELLRSRSWMDIPLTYRNGRRALLTLEKGSSGTDAFTKALQAWSLAAKPIPAVQ